MLWFVLSLGSALFQVLRNMVMKRLGHALDETINVWGRFTFILPFAAAPLLVQGLPPRQPGIYWYCFLFAVTQITGTQCLALALKVAEISLVTALWKLSVVLLVVWGYLTLGEEPSFLGVVGVLVCVAGVYLINVSRARVSLWAPLVSLVRDPGQRYTLGAALFYAPSVVIIKKIALLSSPTYAVFMGYLFCSVLITPWVLYRSARHFRQLGRHWLGFVGLGAFAALSTQLGTTAYTMTVSSYVEAVKQIEILLALVIGWLDVRRGRARSARSGLAARSCCGHRHPDTRQGLTRARGRLGLAAARPLPGLSDRAIVLSPRRDVPLRAVRTEERARAAAHGRHAMPKYLFEASYSPGRRQGRHQGRRLQAPGRDRGALKGLGGRLEAFYFAYGETDAFVIVELPDTVSATAVALTVGGERRPCGSRRWS